MTMVSFAAAEEAALCVARWPEGQEAAERARTVALPIAPMTREQALQQAQAEGLTLRKADNKSGYAGVTVHPGKRKSYQAQVYRSGTKTLGNFATAEEAALCIARSPEGQAAAAAAAVPPKVPLTREQALQQAQAEGLALRKAETKAGYANVTMLSVTRAKPYQAQVTRSGTTVTLGTFATAEEAALCVARSPEGQRAAELACAVVLPRTQLAREQALQQAQAEGILLRKADNKSGYSNVTVSSTRPKPYRAQVKRDGKNTVLGSFDTAEEAALCVARSPEGQLAIKRVAKRAAAAAPPPLTREQALQHTSIEAPRCALGPGKSKVARHSPRRVRTVRERTWEESQHQVLC